MNRKLSVLICSLCTLFYIFGKKSGIMNTFENNANSQKQEGCRLTVPIPHCTCTRNILIPDVELCHGNNSVLTLQNIIQRYGNSSCSDLATLRGANQSVISLSLFGKFPGDYFAGARILAERVKSMYPGWVLRIYHILDMKQLNQHDWLCSLLCDHPHIDTCHAVNLPVLGDISNNSTGMVWRFSVVGDPLIARYAIRDADSSILQREVDAVNDWVKSGKCYHVMRDNYYHHLPVMGGMWGGCNWWKREEALAIREQLLLTRVQAEDQISLRVQCLAFSYTANQLHIHWSKNLQVEICKR
ncbi:unnamed protein product [Meganyctiphanes norvegica]|uniref:Uncharacterized protein n=1 Tax=Meganyctiphanes norvegica TaxID=48144 RepID=A0AAV2QX37_MEGNR